MNAKLRRYLKRALLKRILPQEFYLCVDGYCPCCKRQTEFLAYDPWLRDSFKCIGCGSIPRNRALLCILEKHYPLWQTLSIHESSPSEGGASQRLKADCHRYTSTQFHPSRSAGEDVDGHRNENLEHQTFDDESFDIVITQDVLEHVYNPSAVFSEIARTLKPGGAHIFAVPIINKHKATQVWATRGENGKPNFLHEPEYHGNPIDSKGSPVTMHWGYDIVSAIRDSCGLETLVEYLDDLHFGVRAEYIEILVTKKPGLLLA